MAWFYKLSIRWKLLGMSAVLIAAMAAVGFVAVRELNGSASRTTTIYEKHLVGLHAIDDALIDVVSSGRAEKNAILAEDEEEFAKHEESAIDFLEDATLVY